MTRKDDKNIKMHSKKTGAFILVGLVAFLVGGSIFMFLAWNENENFEIEFNEFKKLSCADMVLETNIIDLALDKWKLDVYQNKVMMGDCGSEGTILFFDSCSSLFAQLEKATGDQAQNIHDKLKASGC